MLTPAQLRDANEHLIIATVRAQSLAEAAEEAGAKLSFTAEHDFLTGLPNRSLLTDRLAQAIELAKRQSRMLALMYLDLDHFKEINDSLGHAVGDQLLQEVSRRLQACVRHSDTVSRQGGDEFVILLPVIEGLDDAALLARKLIEAMARPFSIEGQELKITLSIGISRFPNDGSDVDSVVRNADTAMYKAKELGRNNYQVFTQGMGLAPDRQAVHVARATSERDQRTAQTASPAVPPGHDSNRPQSEAPVGVPPGKTQPGPASVPLTLPEREAALLANERTSDLREEAADLREDAADLRENAVAEREKTLRTKEEAARLEAESSVSTQAQLQEANEHLVIATVQAHTMKEAAEKATEQLGKNVQTGSPASGGPEARDPWHPGGRSRP